MTHLRGAPTPTNSSTNSQAEIEKNGTCASPASAQASSVLPVPGDRKEHPARDPAAEAPELVGVVEEVDELDQLLLVSSILATSTKLTVCSDGSTR
jgi:hypothetical protein